MIRAIIIGENTNDIHLLSSLFKTHCKEDIEVVATSTSPHEGKLLIEQYNPDLVFIDVDMPRINKPEYFTNIRSKIVYLTACNNYTVEAFRLSSLNYLSKPIIDADVINLVQKIKDDPLHHNNYLMDGVSQLEKLFARHADGSDNKIGISMADKIIFIHISDIVFCEARGSYTVLCLMNGESLMTSRLLIDFEKQLAQHNFFRIHHHCLINLNKVKEYQRNHGGYVIMENGKELEVSKRKRKDFLSAIDKITI